MRTYPACMYSMSTVSEFRCALCDHDNDKECPENCPDNTEVLRPPREKVR
jgi:hypothetical protein